jgi:hypothetical protein
VESSPYQAVGAIINIKNYTTINGIILK